MTREELREYVEELESQGEIPYYVYSNLIDCIDTLEQEPTTKNDLGVDCISRIETIDYLCKHCPDDGECFKDCDDIKHLRQMPSVTPQEPRWIPMARREPTVEEKREYLAQNGEELCYMLENEMPLNGQEVLVSIGEMVSEDVFDEDFYNFENNDIENVGAWMPLPQPYKADKCDKGCDFCEHTNECMPSKE